MASTRLRKTFKYPSEDEDSDASRDELDEEGNLYFLTAMRRVVLNCNVQNKNHSSPTYVQRRPNRMLNTG